MKTSSSPLRHRILIVDDHPVVSTGMAELLNHEPDLEVCGSAHNASSALEMVESLRPDVILLDVSLTGRSGLELLKDIKARHPQQRVLMLSMHDESLYAARSLRAGALGYLMKAEATQTLLLAVRRVLAGEYYLSPSFEKQFKQRLLQQPPPVSTPMESLSDRELEVFRMIGQGKTSREISQILFLSVKTIESHRANIKEKLGLATGADLVRRAIQFERERDPGMMLDVPHETKPAAVAAPLA